MKAGQCAIIKAVRGHGELRRHLLDMGLTPGIGVRVRKVAPMGDPLIEREREALTGFIEALERQGGLDREAALANMRFSFIERLCARTIVRPHESREHVRSVAADRILTGRFTAIPCFILIMGFVFLVFTLLYTPCVAAIATTKKEMNGRTAAKLVVSQCVVAWVVAFCIRAVGLAFGLV